MVIVNACTTNAKMWSRVQNDGDAAAKSPCPKGAVLKRMQPKRLAFEMVGKTC
jgi:hypothetical protein